MRIWHFSDSVTFVDSTGKFVSDPLSLYALFSSCQLTTKVIFSFLHHLSSQGAVYSNTACSGPALFLVHPSNYPVFHFEIHLISDHSQYFPVLMRHYFGGDHFLFFNLLRALIGISASCAVSSYFISFFLKSRDWSDGIVSFSTYTERIWWPYCILNPSRALDGTLV